MRNREAQLILILAVMLLTSAHVGSGLTTPIPQCRISELSIFSGCDTTEPGLSGSMSKQDLTLAGFSVGRSTLAAVAHRFPGTKRFRLTREEEAPLGICVKNKDGIAIVFASGSSGGWDVLDTIYVASAKSLEKQGAKCSSSELTPSEIATQSGIRLGATTTEIRQLLPEAAISDSAFRLRFSTRADKASWAARQVKPAESEGWVALSGAIGGFQAGRLRWFILYGSVTN